MLEGVTLKQVERLAEQLPADQRLKLAETIFEQLGIKLAIDQIENGIEKSRQRKLKLVEQLLSEVDDAKDDSKGKFDSAADIRRLREERIRQICQSDA